VETSRAPQWILHVDLDQFLAAVEIRRRPELRGLPVIVGGEGDPTKARQVVATASYEARAFGVHSGMPLRLAHRKCPDGVFLASDRTAYDAASAEVMAVLRSFGHPVEVWGWDEAALGAETDDPEALAQAIRGAVLAKTGLTCAVGIGETKERAKMATGFAKESAERVFRLSSVNWVPLMGDRDVTALWGIGKRTAARLAEHEVRTVVELATADRDDLARWFGPATGPALRVLARGGAARTISTEERVARSRSKQVTYPRDIADAEEIRRQIGALTREVCAEVFAEGRTATHVGVVVRTASFFTQVKTGKLAQPTTEPEPVVERALIVLDRFEITRPVRLLGIRVDLA
jgi:DNA polymerase-4